jgi:hypothetical protein
MIRISNKLLLFLLYFSTNKTSNSLFKNTESEKEKYTILFVHGSYGINFRTFLEMIFYNIFSDKKLKALFNKISQMRFNKKLSHHKSICSNKKGLDEISKESSSHYSFEYVFKGLNNQFEELLDTRDIKYYSFNWHGCLSDQLRKLESNILYYELEKLKKIDPERKLIIVAFSHGGNIVLNIPKNSNLNIDLLILLATPIGKNSEKNATNQAFSQIINIYSSKDFYQIFDIFFDFPKIKRFFSNAKNIINIDLRFLKNNSNNKKKTVIFPSHKYFGYVDMIDKELPIFLSILPSILNEINKKKNSNSNQSHYIMTINIDEYIHQSLKNNFKIEIKKKS